MIGSRFLDFGGHDLVDLGFDDYVDSLVVAILMERKLHELSTEISCFI